VRKKALKEIRKSIGCDSWIQSHVVAQLSLTKRCIRQVMSVLHHKVNQDTQYSILLMQQKNIKKDVIQTV